MLISLLSVKGEHLLLHVNERLTVSGREECKAVAEGPSEALQGLGYWVSVKKNELCVPCVTCLGYTLEASNEACSRAASQ